MNSSKEQPTRTIDLTAFSVTERDAITRVFHFHQMALQVLTIGGELIFRLKHLCECLGLENPSLVVKDYTDNEKVYIRYIPGSKVLGVTEAGLYRTIFRSDKPNAKAFQDFVFETILPTIRKTGRYIANESPLLPSKSADRMSNMAASVFRSGNGSKKVKKTGASLKLNTAIGLLSVAVPDLEEFESYRYNRKFTRGLSMALANEYRSTRGKTPPTIRSKRPKSVGFGYPQTYEKLVLAFIGGWQPDKLVAQ
jgi:prophage antirepressor-like protein